MQLYVKSYSMRMVYNWNSFPTLFHMESLGSSRSCSLPICLITNRGSKPRWEKTPFIKSCLHETWVVSEGACGQVMIDLGIGMLQKLLALPSTCQNNVGFLWKKRSPHPSSEVINWCRLPFSLGSLWWKCIH